MAENTSSKKKQAIVVELTNELIQLLFRVASQLSYASTELCEQR